MVDVSQARCRLYFNPFLPPVQSEYIKIKVDPWSVILKGDVVPWSQNARKSGVVWPVTTLNRNPRVSIYPNAYEQNVVLWRAGSNAGRVISRTYGSKARAKNLFSVTLFFQAPLILRAIRRPNRVMRFRPTYSSWKKTTGHNLRPQPIPSFSLAFGAAEKNMNFKMSLEIWISKKLSGYISFRMGVPDMGYVYAKYPPKILNKLSTYGNFFLYGIFTHIHII